MEKLTISISIFNSNYQRNQIPFNHHVPLVFLCFFHFPMVFPILFPSNHHFPIGFPIFFPIFQWFSYGFPSKFHGPRFPQGSRPFRPARRMGRARHRGLRCRHRGKRRGARHRQRRRQRRPLAALALQREHGAKRLVVVVVVVVVVGLMAIYDDCMVM